MNYSSPSSRLLALALLFVALSGLQGCKSPSGGQSGIPMPQIPGVPKTSIPSIPGIPQSGSPGVPSAGIPGMPGVPGMPGGKPGGKPGGDANGEKGGKKDGKKGGKKGGKTAGVPGAPGAGGSGSPGNDPNGNTPEQGDDWLGDKSASDDDWATSNTLPGGKGSDQTGASDPVSASGGVAGTGKDGKGSGGKLDDALDSALEDFDGEILAEREAILKRNQRTASTSGGNGKASGKQGNQGGAGGSVETGSGNGKAPPDIKDRSYIPDTRNSPSAPPAGSNGGRVITDKADARDDDVFARQLREAAVNEADPELREKLWEEYRRYKGSS